MNLVNELRMLAEDLHAAHGTNKFSTAMSRAADEIQKLAWRTIDTAPPDEDVDYLCWSPDLGLVIYSGWCIKHGDCKATHWMNPPEDEQS